MSLNFYSQQQPKPPQGTQTWTVGEAQVPISSSLQNSEQDSDNLVPDSFLFQSFCNNDSSIIDEAQQYLYNWFQQKDNKNKFQQFITKPFIEQFIHISKQYVIYILYSVFTLIFLIVIFLIIVIFMLLEIKAHFIKHLTQQQTNSLKLFS